MLVADDAELVVPPFPPPPPVLAALASRTAVPSTSSNAGESAVATGAKTSSTARGTSASHQPARANPGMGTPERVDFPRAGRAVGSSISSRFRRETTLSGNRRRRWIPSGLDEPPTDRVARQLHAVAHAELV